MAVSTAQRLARDKYRKEKRDQMTVEIPKGKREVYKLIAAELDRSLAQLIQDAVEEYGANHGGENLSLATQNQEQKLSAADKKLIEEFNRLPAETQKALIKLIQSINQNAKQDSFPE